MADAHTKSSPPPPTWLVVVLVLTALLVLFVMASVSAGSGAEQINVEYFFRLLYECLNGRCYGSGTFVGLYAVLTQLWVWITVIGYFCSVVGLFVIVYAMVRLFELRKMEAEKYATPILQPDAAGGAHPRWQHIQALIGGASKSEWREAIMEADIMLDDILAQEGYEGEGIAEKLKSASPATFGTLQEAWQAHKVRNQIAHEGSSFDLSQTLARRTVGQYEAVFREFGAV